MTHVVTENCIKCKYMDCVLVCPVDCFYEGVNMLFINPTECIDCGVCVPECPAEAIKEADDNDLQWLEINAKMSTVFPNVTTKKDPFPEADAMNGAPNKFEQFFHDNEKSLKS